VKAYRAISIFNEVAVCEDLAFDVENLFENSNSKELHLAEFQTPKPEQSNLEIN
jgi:hypothetical protein